MTDIYWSCNSERKRKFDITNCNDQDISKKRRTSKSNNKNKDSDKHIHVDKIKKLIDTQSESMEECAGEDGSEKVYSHDNHIYFYTGIGMSSIISLQKEVQEVINKLLEKSKGLTELEFTVQYPPINLHINSPGGGIFAAFTFIDFMCHIKRKYPNIKFHTIVEGRAASAATLISVTGDKRFITENGYMLIHQLWSLTMGKYNEIIDDMNNLHTLMDRIKHLYTKHATIPNDKLDDILKHDLYWDAETCKKYKLVDEILK